MPAGNGTDCLEKRPLMGVVVIGRNEGERLKRCLTSCPSECLTVYVDSGSTDGSVQFAREQGCDVVQLDPNQPFAAARARNEGLDRLRTQVPDVDFVQFLDGDCELLDGWIEHATAALQQDARLAVAAGRRKEREPLKSIYNLLCDIEWNTPIGEAKACGGDSLMRVSALVDVGGFNPAVIAGEEPELCVRLRTAGWRIRRLERDMTLHDADMTHFRQWWRRMERSGHAYAQGAAMHGRSPERHWVRELSSIALWGGLLPIMVVIGVATAGVGGLSLLLGYVWLASRARTHYRRRGFNHREAWLAGTFNVLAKFPQLLGAFRFLFNRLLSTETVLIEYKGATS